MFVSVNVSNNGRITISGTLIDSNQHSSIHRKPNAKHKNKTYHFINMLVTFSIQIL